RFARRDGARGGQPRRDAGRQAHLQRRGLSQQRDRPHQAGGGMRTVALAALGALAVVATLAFAGEDKVKLRDGPNVDLVRNNCVSCHSLDYIELNSPFLDQKGWEAVVTKMQKALGAQIKQED